MPKLSTLTDAYVDDPMGSALPVVNPYFDPNQTKVIIPTGEEKPKVEEPSALSSNIDKILNSLFRDDENRLQLWPEKVVREALSGAKKVMSGEIPQWEVDPTTGEVHTSPKMVETAQSMAALAGTGGLAGTTEGTLGATPFLRPALKYKDRLYKGKEGQQHLDVIPEALYPEFQKMAMSGEDISHYNFGFVNDRGHFLDREKALQYAIDTGMVDKFAGQYGALTSTLLSDSSKPGMGLEALAKTKAPTFFSAVEHNVNAIPQAKMTGEQWLGTLSNKPGVKPEEMDWTGLKSFLQENKGKTVTKEQIQEHLASNKVELVEKNSHTPNPKLNEMLELDAKARRYEADGEVDAARAIREQIKAIPKTGDFNPRYKDYQLPGGENYREMLLTLPEKKLNKEFQPLSKTEQQRFKDVLNEIAKYEMRGKDAPSELYHELNNLQARKHAANNPVYLEKARQLANENYRSSHWDEPNILAHVRMNDRWMDDPSSRSNVHPGKVKSLHLEEIQSDWHQQGRERGYKSDIPMYEVKPVNEGYGWRLFNNKTKQFEGVTYNEQTARQVAKVANNDANVSGVPDAPFKKNWHELALKRMIREAAEKGYDRLSWTPGEAQSARYDLSKQLKELQYLKNEDGTYSIAGVTKDGGGFNHPEKVSASKLPDIVGKEMAEKIIKNEGKRARGHPANGGYFEGVDLKIGGEGMKGFYDQIIPKALEKISGEKVKVGRVKATDMPASEYEKYPEGHPYKEKNNPKVHYIDIPQSLKDKALGKGFPLFSSSHAGFVFTPVDYEPEFK